MPCGGPAGHVRAQCAESSLRERYPVRSLLLSLHALAWSGLALEYFRTYFTTARGVDRLRLDFNLLDLTPYGRQEEWEDSPDGWPQDPTMTWLRPHDEYDA
jgi:predicted dithiol-disulfide oxidoreductase (DUF899 family)